MAAALPSATAALQRLSKGTPCSAADRAAFSTLSSRYASLAATILSRPALLASSAHPPGYPYVQGAQKFASAWQAAATGCAKAAAKYATLKKAILLAQQLMRYWSVPVISAATQVGVTVPVWVRASNG